VVKFVRRAEDFMEMLRLPLAWGWSLAGGAGRPNRNGFSLWSALELGLTLCGHATLMSVAAPLKNWNNTRIEMKSREASAIAAQGADGRASSQINRISFFNTLNTVSSLIRMDRLRARRCVELSIFAAALAQA